MNEIEVQSCIDNQEDTFLHSIPDGVDADELLADLKTGWNPDTENTYIDDKKDKEGCQLQFPRVVSVDHQDRDSVDNDLEKRLDLDSPKEDCTATLAKLHAWLWDMYIPMTKKTGKPGGMYSRR
jgi:hypothetical protein